MLHRIETFIAVAVALLAAALAALAPTAAVAAECTGAGGVVGGTYGIEVDCSTPGAATLGGGTTPATPAQPAPYLEYKWISICANGPTSPQTDADCLGARVCANPNERLWQLWGRLRGQGWVALRTQCINGTPAAYVPPTVTPGHVLSALRRIGLPRLAVEVQPAAKTLVNFDTIFWTDPQTVSLDLTILGQAVDVVATPQQYSWSFGDGSSMTTSTPGDPYPSRSITHRYEDAQVTVQPHVTVAYSARFQVSGGGWQQIDETVSTTGPAGSLRVAEATPLLSGDRG